MRTRSKTAAQNASPLQSLQEERKRKKRTKRTADNAKATTESGAADGREAGPSADTGGRQNGKTSTPTQSRDEAVPSSPHRSDRKSTRLNSSHWE